jgi:hypothetical protein
VHREKQASVLYPDPPLGQEELAILSLSGVKVQTPLERHALDNDLRSRDLTVGLSVSEAEDLPRFGLRRTHLDAVLLEVSRYLLIAGIRLAYGGHLRADGYTQRMADLLRDPVVEQLRGGVSTATSLRAELVTYLPWPTTSTIENEAKLGPLVEVRHCKRPEGVDAALDPTFEEAPDTDIPVDTPVRRFAWARGLTEMRLLQTAEIAARVVLGGRIGSNDAGYKGLMPGVFEEALLSVRAERPVYLIGAFGGCARLMIDALEGVPRTELTSEHQNKAPFTDELRTLYLSRGHTWESYNDIYAELKERGFAGVKNGLTVDENRELATTRSAERIIEIVLRGLQTMYGNNDA